MAKMSTSGRTGASNRDSAKTQSIRSKIFRRVLPVLVLPLLTLGIISIIGIVLIQQRTSDAVESAENILSEQVVEDGVTRSAERGSRELANYIEDWLDRIDRLNSRAEFRESMVLSSNAVVDAGFANLDDEALRQALSESTTLRTQVLARTALPDLALDDQNVQLLLVSENGIKLGSAVPTEAGAAAQDNTLDRYSDAEWFNEALQTGSSFRSYVNDDEHVPSIEVATLTEAPATVSGRAVMRVRVPLTNVHVLLDEVAGDDAVEISLVDFTSSVLIADTASAHSDEFLFNPLQLTAEGSGFNSLLLAPGVDQDEETVTSARRIADRFDDDGNDEKSEAFNWLIQTSQPIDVAGSSLVEIRQVAESVDEQRQLFTAGVTALLLISLVAGFLLVRSIAQQITAPVKQLSDQAQAAAQDGIPAIVEAARTSEELPELEPFDVDTNDELAILAYSLNTMQDAAVDLAAGQAKLRRQNVARTFVSLGRRNQNLLNRQLEFIDELERQETDADTLENLFRLDHLATRMRRNAENLLVLAGEQTPRRWAKPIAIRDVLRAAAAEIADYRRVRLGDIDAATVSGNLATDLSHLIAELLENAGSFSPPNTPIEVLGQHTSTHYRLAIVDQGIGMDAAALAQVNDRLKNPVDFADAPSAYLGLFVVGRLSQELGITIRLASADPTGEGRRRGTIAFIDLPVSLLSRDAATPIEIDERGAGAAVRAANPTAAASTAPQPPIPQATASPTIPTPPPALAPTPEPAQADAGVSSDAEPSEAEVTKAGFPKRRSRQTAPDSTSSPADISAPQPAEVVPPPTEITAAGFPKRRSAAAGVDETPTPPAEVAPMVPRRDASEVSNSLRSFRAAVARGRASTAGAADPARPEQQLGEPVSGTPARPLPPPTPEQSAPMQPPPLPSEQAAQGPIPRADEDIPSDLLPDHPTNPTRSDS